MTDTPFLTDTKLFIETETMPDTKRIEREIRLCKNDQDTSVTVEPINDNLCHLHGKL